MRGASRKITIAILLILAIVLGAIAVIIGLGLGGTTPPAQVAEGSACATGASPQCLQNNLGNTGYLCQCTQNTWDCSTLDTNVCPTPATGETCTAGEVQTGDCGTAGCTSGQRPTRQCAANGQFGTIQCTDDTACVATSSSSTSSSTTSVSGEGCEITVPASTDSFITIGANCPTEYTYQLKTHIVDADPGNTSASCTTIVDPLATVTAGVPGSTYELPTATCGKCVRLELIDAPEGTTPAEPYSTATYTGDCAAASTSTSSTAASSTTSSLSSTTSSSSSTTSLPDTGLFDNSQSPLLIGLILILLGLWANRLIGGLNFLFSKVDSTKKSKYESRVEDSIES